MTYVYECANCNKEFDVIKSYRDIDAVEKCDSCGAEAKRLFRPSANSIFKSQGIAESPQYNPGLGEVVKSKKHLKEIVKSRGLVEVGNESPDKMFKHYDKAREEKRERDWEKTTEGWVGNGE